MKMNRRRLLTALAAVSSTPALRSQTGPKYRFHSGLVAYSYRKELAAKSLNYDSLIERIAAWGLDGLDCTVYWFPDTSPEFLARLRKTAFKNGVQIYNAGVRVQLSRSPRRSYSRPSSKTSRSGSMSPIESAPATCASSAAISRKAQAKLRLSPGRWKCSNEERSTPAPEESR